MKGVRLALRLSRGAGRHERVRSLVMIVGVALATLGLAVGVTLPRVTAQQQEVRDARTPILAPDEPADGHTGFKVQELQVDGTPRCTPRRHSAPVHRAQVTRHNV